MTRNEQLRPLEPSSSQTIPSAYTPKGPPFCTNPNEHFLSTAIAMAPIVPPSRPTPPTLSVLLTGFEPFGNSTTNPSWLAVSQIPTRIETPHAVLHVHTIELPVEYTPVSQLVPSLHSRTRPHIVLHVGQGLPGRCCLERTAHTKGYVKLDNKRRAPGIADETEEDKILRVDDAVLRRVFEAVVVATDEAHPCGLVISDDAGRYLCEYTLATSLRLGTTECTFFLHVPVTHVDESVRLIRKVLEAAAAVYVEDHGNGNVGSSVNDLHDKDKGEEEEEDAGWVKVGRKV
ncbi:Pyroglutamyl-peptidase 1 [Thoreauomyces humboldtii]|nr:Pyroglutamyl-peptidase 1 [Thoreauomyces humboldtii]